MPPKRRKTGKSAKSSLAEFTRVIRDSNRPFQFADADVAIISADGYLFKVHRDKLSTSSAVFKHMVETTSLGLDTAATLQLTDDLLETALVLNIYFSLLYGFKIHIDREELALIDTVFFLQKFECAVALRTLQLELHSHLLHGSWSPVTVFVACANMHDQFGCTEAVRKFYSDHYGKAHVVDPNHNVFLTGPNSRIESPGCLLSAMSPSDIAATPALYLSCLIRTRQAMAVCPDVDGDEAEWLAMEFDILLDTAARTAPK